MKYVHDAYYLRNLIKTLKGKSRLFLFNSIDLSYSMQRFVACLKYVKSLTKAHTPDYLLEMQYKKLHDVERILFLSFLKKCFYINDE